jgi:hypothetical protein
MTDLNDAPYTAWQDDVRQGVRHVRDLDRLPLSPAERGEAERKPGGIDRIVGRGRRRDGKRLAEAGEGDARNPARRRPGTLESAQRIEEMEARAKFPQALTPSPSPQGGGGFYSPSAWHIG